jgi:hypothetical protein
MATTAQSSRQQEPAMYILIDNIPLEYHTPDLRNFFSYSIENETFLIFNYRHRPKSSQNNTCNICICKIRANKFDEVVKLYSQKNWLDARGLVHVNRCKITKIKIVETSSEASKEAGVLSQDELNSLLEFRNIPSWMEQGNVGTPTKTFVNYINQAIMPVSLIQKLGINFKMLKKNKKRVYANVSFDYGTSKQSSTPNQTIV